MSLLNLVINKVNNSSDFIISEKDVIVKFTCHKAYIQREASFDTITFVDPMNYTMMFQNYDGYDRYESEEGVFYMKEGYAPISGIIKYKKVLQYS